MLGFFPHPYPDELLYSVLARYHMRSGNLSPKVTLQELFYSTKLTAVVDLPSRLSTLVSNLPANATYTADELIINHTLYSYYTAFLPKERAQLIYESMKGNFGGSIHTRIGIMASSVATPKYLRYCPTCSKEDWSQRGEMYWHRVHQIPGVLVCPTHHVLLVSSKVLLSERNRHEFIYASRENSPFCDAVPSQNEKINVLADDLKRVLDNGITSYPSSWFRDRYVALLRKKGFVSPNGFVNQTMLHEYFNSYYGNALLEKVYATARYEEANNWLQSIVRKHRKVFHPVHHVLMIQFLAGSLNIFFSESTSFQSTAYQPFGVSPWLCLNKAADHYLNRVVNKIEITRCTDTKKPVATFACSCGFIYSRRGPDQTKDDQKKIGRIKVFGPVWEAKLRKLVRNENLSLRETARQLGADANTVKKYAILLGLSPKWLKNHRFEKQIKSNNRDNRREHYRKQWSKLLQEYPTISKTALRKKDQSAFTWLYRHDKQWLNAHSPITLRSRPVNKRVDWAFRDQEVLGLVFHCVNELLNESKPVQITVSRIGKKIGKLGLLEKHLKKMPETKMYLESVIETIEKYQIRRLRWATQQLVQENDIVERWKILRLAGLKNDLSPQLISELDQTLQM
ncbi:TnsD family transposase [Brevibacillus sp. SYSU BS000544]|uniref:TnsD family transposase n=1 Tax=Brevibacillus sp. SYSU BS000544 TaxID=3416443 RepID=UPI003CE4713C